MLITILFLILSAIFRAIEQIGAFRPLLTWLPPWFTRKDAPFHFDGYHVFSSLNLFCMGVAGYSFYWHISPWWLPLFWLIHGNVFSLFYHVIFMRKEFRENFFLDWLLNLCWLFDCNVPDEYIRNKLRHRIRMDLWKFQIFTPNNQGKVSDNYIDEILEVQFENAKGHWKKHGSLDTLAYVHVISANRPRSTLNPPTYTSYN